MPARTRGQCEHALRVMATGWVISGAKQWITNSPTADYIFVFAVTDEALKVKRKGGVSCFVVPMNSPGLKVDSVIKLFGNIGGDEGIVSFTDVRVPASALVGELHRGFDLALAGVSTGRIYNAGRCVGPRALGAGEERRVREAARRIRASDCRIPGHLVRARRLRDGHLRGAYDVDRLCPPARRR